MVSYRKRVNLKIIDQSHKIISLPNNLLQVIEATGRTCYKSEDKIGCAASLVVKDANGCNDGTNKCKNINCEDHSSRKFTKMLLDRGHHAMIEFGDIIVRFVTNRGVTHELVRHRLCSFAQESTRYVRYDGGMEFIRPVWWEETSIGQRELWKYAMSQCETNYQNLLNNGWRPEQAREVLPNSLKTEIVVKANIREFRYILDLRCNKKVHPQFRALVLPLLKDLHDRVPVLFDDLYDKYIKEK